MDHLAFLRRAGELGVRLVQVADNLPLHTLPPDRLDAFEAEAARLGMAVELGTRGLDHGLLRRYLQLCRRFGSPLLRTVVDVPGDEPPLEEVVRRVRAIIADFEEAGVVLAIENHDRFRAREFVRIIQEIDSPCAGICLDTVNSFGALEGPEVVVEALAPYTVNLHVKEFDIRRADFVAGFIIEGKPTGQGRLDIPWLIAELRRHGRDPNAILEQWPYPEADLEATIRKEQQWALESVRYLRALLG
jgi:sugar phosphate isomerase/epimerase